MKQCSGLIVVAACLLFSGNLSAQKVSRKIGYGASPAPSQTEQRGSTTRAGVVNGRQAENNVQPSTNANPSNTNAQDLSIVAGHFELENNAMRGGSSMAEHINVNYSIYPAPFTSVLNLNLNTADPVNFSAEIVDNNNSVVASWKSEQKNHNHLNTMNTSGWPAGKYIVKIFWEKSTDSVFEIPFTKE